MYIQIYILWIYPPIICYLQGVLAEGTDKKHNYEYISKCQYQISSLDDVPSIQISSSFITNIH